jgi:hypothetical protein
MQTIESPARLALVVATPIIDKYPAGHVPSPYRQIRAMVTVSREASRLKGFAAWTILPL